MKKPELKEIADYMGNQEDAILFYSHYESIGWKVGKFRTPMKSWKGAAAGWLLRNKKRENQEADIKKALSNQSTDMTSKLWRRMTHIFGHKWVSNYGPKPTKPWIEFIEKTEPEKIAYGLQGIIKSGEDWPPSLIRFIAMCQCYTVRQKVLTHAISRAELLELREQTRAARDISMTQIKEKLCH